MLAGEPDRFAVLDDEKIFLKGGGLGARGGGAGWFVSGWADRAKGAVGATGNFGKANEGAEFHQSLIMNSWISFGDDGRGKLLKFF
jgi:hypothetical protein